MHDLGAMLLAGGGGGSGGGAGAGAGTAGAGAGGAGASTAVVRLLLTRLVRLGSSLLGPAPRGAAHRDDAALL